MKAIHVRVLLFDPGESRTSSSAGFPVTSSISVDIARFEPFHPEDPDARIPLSPDPVSGLFVAENPDAEPDERWYFRVVFHEVNFVRSLGTLLPAGEITPDMHPVLVPSRVPVWDSGWDGGYSTNEFFGSEHSPPATTPDNPIVLRIPLRRIFLIGHRGAPYHFPENTIVSFRRALEQGANGLEFDLCCTRDSRAAVFHDPSPDRTRRVFEDFPFPLESPEVHGRIGLVKKLRRGRYIIASRKFLFRRDYFHLARLSMKRVRAYYRYRHVSGVEYPIPELEEFLEFAAAENGRLHLLFFDVKNPAWDEVQDREKYLAYAHCIGSALRRFPRLPDTLVIANERKEVISLLKKGIESAGERRCVYAWDAAGSLGAWLGFGEDPHAIARELGTQVVSVGTRFRAGDLHEIMEATRDRDSDSTSPVTTVLHWTLNDVAQMRASLAAGVNGIVTDRVNRLVSVLHSLGIAHHSAGGAPQVVAGGQNDPEGA